MKIFTVQKDSIKAGAKVEKIALKGAGIEILAVTIGEEGRGRKRELLPVDPRAVVETPQGLVIEAASVGKTQSGKPRLNAATSDEDHACIVVMRTSIGFRGSNTHRGDRATLAWSCECGASATERPLENPLEGGGMTCPTCGRVVKKDYTFHPFPGQVLAHGIIAEGIAGWAGAGDQYIVVMPRGVVWRVGLMGRLYGSPDTYYYMFDGDTIRCVTGILRDTVEIF